MYVCMCVFVCRTILRLDGDDPLSLRPKALRGLSLNFKFIWHIFTQIRNGQRCGRVPIELEGALISCTNNATLSNNLK